MKKHEKNQSNPKIKSEIFHNEKLQYSIKNTPRKLSNERDLISNKLAQNKPARHTKQNSVNTSKVMISSKTNIPAITQINNYIPVLTEVSKKNTPKTNKLLMSKEKISEISNYNSKFNNDLLSKKISNIKLYENFQSNLNKSKASNFNDSQSHFDNNQSVYIADLKKKNPTPINPTNQISNTNLNDNSSLNNPNSNVKTKPNSKSNSRLEEKSDTSRKSFLNLDLKVPNSNFINNNNNTVKGSHKKMNSNNGSVNNSLLKQNINLNFPPQKNVKSSTNSPKHFSLNFNKEMIENKLITKNVNDTGKSSKVEEVKSSKLNLNLKLNLNSVHNSTNKLDKGSSFFIILGLDKTGNHSFDHILNSSTCSGLSTIRESNYYKKEAEKLTKYVKHYFNKMGDYPPTNIKFYKYGRVLGKGAFGKVNLGLHIQSGRLVAIKSFNKLLFKNENAKKKIFYETNLMKNIRHNSIAK
jgi:hypothetical protein